MTRILTWNLQGREGPPLAVVADEITAREPDVVLLQEVQRKQADDLGRRLGWAVEWRFKHWPIVFPAEGLAVLTPLPPRAVRSVRLAAGLRFWSWRRRIAIAATIDGPGGVLAVVNVHLGAGVGDAERLRQAQATVKLAGRGLSVIAGDLNSHPGSIVLGEFGGSGFRDAWHDVHPQLAGATNWAPGPRTAPPTQRLDYVLISPGLWARHAEVPDHEGFGRISDHLPLLVEIEATSAS